MGNERQRAMMEANGVPFELLAQTEALWTKIDGHNSSGGLSSASFIGCCVACGLQAEELEGVVQRHKPLTAWWWMA